MPTTIVTIRVPVRIYHKYHDVQASGPDSSSYPYPIYHPTFAATHGALLNRAYSSTANWATLILPYGETGSSALGIDQPAIPSKVTADGFTEFPPFGRPNTIAGLGITGSLAGDGPANYERTAYSSNLAKMRQILNGCINRPPPGGDPYVFRNSRNLTISKEFLATKGVTVANDLVYDLSTNAGFKKAFYSGYVDALTRLQKPVLEAPDGDPKSVSAMDGGTMYKYFFHENAVKLGLEKVTSDYYVDLVIATDGTGFAEVTDPLAMTPCGVEAKAAANAWDKSLKKAILMKTEGATPTWPSASRPSATTATCLEDYQRQVLDSWWDRSSRLLDEAKAATAPSNPYDNYTAAGGTLSEQEWNSSRDGRVNAATQGENGQGFMNSVTSGLGWAANKVADGLGWLGDATFDLMKTWGPAGTVGAYAGYKATNAITGGNTPKWLMIGALAIGAIVLLK